MDERTMDSMTRRASLLATGLAGPLAFGGQFASAGKKKSTAKLKKAKKACQQDLAACTAQGGTCAAQVEACETIITAICQGDPACLQIGACCALLEDCDAAAFITCAFNVD